MTSLRDYLGPGGRMLARRLDQLCATLENLSVRLHTTIANAIGETITGIVRDITLGILNDLWHVFPRPPSVYRHPQDSLAQDYCQRDRRGYWPDEEEAVQYETENDDHPTEPQRLPTALAAGLQAAAWWLRRWSGQSGVLTTVAVGALAAGAAFLGGPLVVVILTMAGSAAQFTRLSDLIGPGEAADNLHHPG